jgi:hypothetical protein
MAEPNSLPTSIFIPIFVVLSAYNLLQLMAPRLM